MVRSNRLFKIIDSFTGVLYWPLIRYFILFPRKRVEHLKPEKVLVIKLCCFGDSLLSILSLKALKEKHPGVYIAVLCGSRTASVFERSGFIDEVITLPISGTRGLFEFLHVFKVVATMISVVSRRFDVFLDYDVYYRFTTIMGLFCGKSYSAGFETYPGRSVFYNNKVPRPKDAPEWKLFFEMLAPFDVDEIKWTMLSFRIAVTEEDAIRKFLNKIPSGTISVGIMMGGSPNWPEKRWPLEYFAELMKMLNAVKPTCYFLFGLPVERELAKKLIRLYGQENVFDITGQTPFPMLYGVIRKQDLFISNDTGPMHLSALVGTPTLGIFGPTTEKKWSPPGRFLAVTASNCKCRPCYYLSAMPECDNLKCLKGILPEKVFKSAVTMMEGSLNK